MQQIEKPKNAVIYVRVSSKQQVDGFSLDVQEKICREYCERTGYEVLRVFREEGESAKTVNRTELREMTRFCEQNKKQISMIIFYDVSRMSRDVADYHALKVVFAKYGISVVSATQQFDSSPSGKLQETILSAFAQFDNDARSVRTKEGMKARLLKGLWSTIAPWGYFNTRDEADVKIITPHPERAPIVKMIFEKYSTGKYTFKELAAMANKSEQRSRHGRKIYKQHIAKIISNPIYYGMIVFPKFDISIMGLHKPIISEELFKKAQDVRNGVVDKKQPRTKDNTDLPLRGGIRCGECGRNMTGGRTMGKMKKKYYYYYNCYNDDCPKKGMVHKENLENDFTKLLLELTPNDDFFDGLKEAIRLAHKVELASVVSSEKSIHSKIAGLNDRKNKLLDLKIEGGMSTSEFKLKNEEWNFQIKELENSLATLSSPELEVDNVIDSGVEFLKHLPEKWRELDVKDLRVLRSLLFLDSLSYNYPTIKTLEVCCIYNIKSEFLSQKTHQVTLRGIEPRFQA